MVNWNSVKLRWFNKPTHIENYDELVRKDCTNWLGSLNRVSDLAYHNIYLSNSYEYDVITVWGEEGSDSLFCDYDPKV